MIMRVLSMEDIYIINKIRLLKMNRALMIGKNQNLKATYIKVKMKEIKKDLDKVD